MKHTIEISTVDALLICQVLQENNIQNEIDRYAAEKLRENILRTVGNQLQEHVIVHNK